MRRTTRVRAKSYHLACTALLLVGCVLAPALKASAQIDGVWRFEELAKEALRTYPEILAGRRHEQAADAEWEAARWQRFPTPAFESSVDSRDAISTVLSLNQPLWTGGRIRAGIEGSEARHAAAGAAVHDVEQRILLRVAEHFAEVRRRQAQQAIARENILEVERLHDMIQRRVNQRVSPQVDLDLARSRLFQARNELATIDQALQAGLTKLAQLSGLAPQRVAGEVPELVELPQTLDEAQRRAETHAPRLEQLEHQTRAASADVRAERAARVPTVALSLQKHERRGETIIPGQRSDTRLVLSVQSSFGAGLETRATIQAADARRFALRDEQEAALRELHTEVSEAWYELASARLRVASATSNRESTARVYESYNRQYVIGQASWLDVMNALRESNAAALAVEDAQAEETWAQLRLAVLAGGVRGFLESTVQ